MLFLKSSNYDIFQYQPLCEGLQHQHCNYDWKYNFNTSPSARGFNLIVRLSGFETISIPAPLRGASAIAYNKRHAILFDHNNFAQIIVNHAIITPNNWRYNHRNVLHFDENLPVQSCTPPVLLLFPYERRIFRNISPNILRHQLCL